LPTGGLFSFLFVRWSQFAGESRRLGEKIVSLWEASGLTSRHTVPSNGTPIVPSKFQQMCSDSVQAMMISQPGIRLEGVQQRQSLRWAVHHGHRNGSIQRDHWVVGHGFEQIVKRQDLKPIGVLGAAASS
jgi:hypothetical protein